MQEWLDDYTWMDYITPSPFNTENTSTAALVAQFSLDFSGVNDEPDEPLLAPRGVRGCGVFASSHVV